MDACGLKQMTIQTSALYRYAIALGFLFFAPFLNQSARNASGVEMGYNFTFFTPCENRGRLVEMSIRNIRATHRF